VNLNLKEIYLNEKIDFSLPLERVQQGTIHFSVQSINFNKKRPENSKEITKQFSDKIKNNNHEEESSSLSKRYEIKTRIGKGGMGTVYKAMDVQKNVVVALKKVNCDDTASLNQSMKEVTPMLKLSHENLVSYKDFYFSPSGEEFSLCIIMEFYENGDLDHYLRHNEVSKELKLSFMKQLASGLNYLHENNLIHRDLKPENVFLCGNSFLL
jgi:hypothetical protein